MNASVPERNQTQEFVYKVCDDCPLYLTFLPPTKHVRERAPVFAVVSGGGWQVQSREAILSMYASSIAQLRQAGACVVSMDYRVTSKFHDIGVAEEAADVLDAISYIHRYAEVLSVDPDRIVLTGHSAGGHLILLAAYAPRELFPTAYPDPGISFMGCVPFSAPCFLYPSDRCAEPLRMNYDYIFPGAAYDDRLARVWSPSAYVTAQCPPTLFIHGAADDLVPSVNSVLTYEMGVKLGAKFSLIHAVHGGHCLEPMTEGAEVAPSYEEVQNQITAWVRERMNQ